jgi:hypothetical protein
MTRATIWASLDRARRLDGANRHRPAGQPSGEGRPRSTRPEDDELVSPLDGVRDLVEEPLDGRLTRGLLAARRVDRAMQEGPAGPRATRRAMPRSDVRRHRHTGRSVLVEPNHDSFGLANPHTHESPHRSILHPPGQHDRCQPIRP